MARRMDRFDPEIVNLDGGLFAGLPRQELPLALFGLQGKVIEPAGDDTPATTRPRQTRIDSVAPMAIGVDHGAPEPRRAGSWLTGAAMGASAACLVAVALMPSAPFKAQPGVGGATMAAAAQTETETETESVTETETVPASVPETVPAAVPEAPVMTLAPVILVAPIPVKAAPKAAKPAPAPVEAAVAPHFTTADFPDLPPAPKPPEVPFARAAAAVAVADAGKRAASCRDAEAGPLAVTVSVTFAPSGHATGARVDGGVLFGTPAGSCLARALRGATVPAFDGDDVTVHTTVHLR